MKNQQNIKVLRNDTDVVNVEHMNENVECLCCNEVKAAEYSELLGMRYGDVNPVTEFQGPTTLLNLDS